MAEIRLQKFLSECSVASRRKSEELIREGKVWVNGKKASIGDKVDPKRDDGGEIFVGFHWKPPPVEETIT